MFRSWLLNWRLARMKQKVKRLHAEQREVRKALEELETARKKGRVSDEAYASEKTRLDHRKSDLTHRVNEVAKAEADAKLELAALS